MAKPFPVERGLGVIPAAFRFISNRWSIATSNLLISIDLFVCATVTGGILFNFSTVGKGKSYVGGECIKSAIKEIP